MMTLALAAVLALPAGAPPRPASGFAAGIAIADITITQALIIRLPRHRQTRPATPFQQQYRERRGPQCIDASQMGGAAVTGPDTVDIVLKGGQRVRAKLEDACPALDYYSRFYVQPGPDGKLCADRDSIHSRSGGDCEIDRFRKLDPISKP